MGLKHKSDNVRYAAITGRSVGAGEKHHGDPHQVCLRDLVRVRRVRLGWWDVVTDRWRQRVHWMVGCGHCGKRSLVGMMWSLDGYDVVTWWV